MYVKVVVFFKNFVRDFKNPRTDSKNIPQDLSNDVLHFKFGLQQVGF